MPLVKFLVVAVIAVNVYGSRVPGFGANVEKKVENMSVSEALDVVSRKHPKLHKMYLKATSKNLRTKKKTPEVKALLKTVKAEIDEANEEGAEDFRRCAEQKKSFENEIALQDTLIEQAMSIINSGSKQMTEARVELNEIFFTWLRAYVDFLDEIHELDSHREGLRIEEFHRHIAMHGMKKTINAMKCPAASFVQVDCHEEEDGSSYTTIRGLPKVHKSAHRHIQKAFHDAVLSTKKARDAGDLPSLVQVEEHVSQTPGAIGGAVKPERKTACALDEKPNCKHLMAHLLAMFGETEDAFIQKQEEISENLEDRRQAIEDFWRTTYMLAKAYNAAQVNFSTAVQTIDQGNNQKGSAEHFKFMVGQSLIHLMHMCQEDHDAVEVGLCGVKKLRQEIMAFFPDLIKEITGGSDLIMDCVMDEMQEVGGCHKKTDENVEHECRDSDSDSPGVQKYERVVASQPTPIYGAKCVHSEMELPCGSQRCAIDCKLNGWSDWGECTRMCDGGMQSRTRTIDTAPDFGGKECDRQTEVQECNTFACDEDCVLGDYGEFSECSAHCNQDGYKIQFKEIQQPARGTGICPPKGEMEYSNYEECNVSMCESDDYICNGKYNVVVVVESSDALASDKDWERNQRLATDLISNWAKSKSNITLSVVNAGGPASLAEWAECRETSNPGVCHFSAYSCKEVGEKECSQESLDGAVTFAKEMKRAGGANGVASALADASQRIREKGDSDGDSIVYYITSNMMDSKKRAIAAVKDTRQHSRLIFIITGQEAKSPDGVMSEDYKMLVSRPKEKNVFYLTPDELDSPIKLEAEAYNLLIAGCSDIVDPNATTVEDETSEETTEEAAAFL